ncbi:MAG TPA: MerR family transcriptional regulator [Acidimicrobiales bacterium]|nr:MerR family transcriptional regulator [Acidimicrobiales bacterium]
MSSVPRRGAAPPPAGRPWRERVSDPDEPLFTMAVAIDLLGTTPHALRRLESAIDFAGERPSGNQRRYSVRDLEVLSALCELYDRGLSPQTAATVHRELGVARAPRDRTRRPGVGAP